MANLIENFLFGLAQDQNPKRNPNDKKNYPILAKLFPNIRADITDFVLPTNVESPFDLSGEMLSSSGRFKRSLAQKKGLKSTNLTGGIREQSNVVRPTLFTL